VIARPPGNLIEAAQFFGLRVLAGLSFRRLTLRSATGKSQRDFPYQNKNSIQGRTRSGLRIEISCAIVRSGVFSQAVRGACSLTSHAG